MVLGKGFQLRNRKELRESEERLRNALNHHTAFKDNTEKIIDFVNNYLRTGQVPDIDAINRASVLNKQSGFILESANFLSLQQAFKELEAQIPVVVEKGGTITSNTRLLFSLKQNIT